MSEAKERAWLAVARLGLTVESVFVPWSKSRNKGDKLPSLNWVVSLKRNGRLVWAGDYSAGCGHCPSKEEPARRWECENGRQAKFVCDPFVYRGTGPELKPDAIDVIYSLVMDADALDAGGFEEWAGALGYDVDSRKAEKVYNACIDIGLKLRRHLGEGGIAKLREAFQDY